MAAACCGRRCGVRSRDIVLATRVAARSGSVVAYGFIVLGFACLLGRSAIRGVDLFSLGLWALWIGFFLRSATRRSYRELMSELMLRDTTAEGLMRPPPDPVQANMSIQELVDTRIVPTDERAFLVWRGDAVAGMVTLGDVIRLSRQRWPSTFVTEAMVPVDRLVTVAPETALTSAVRLMQERNVAHLPVLDAGRLVGLLDLADVERQVETGIRSAEIDRLRRAALALGRPRAARATAAASSRRCPLEGDDRLLVAAHAGARDHHAAPEVRVPHALARGEQRCRRSTSASTSRVASAARRSRAPGAAVPPPLPPLPSAVRSAAGRSRRNREPVALRYVPWKTAQRVQQVEPLLRARHADVADAPLLLHLRRVVERAHGAAACPPPCPA